MRELPSRVRSANANARPERSPVTAALASEWVATGIAPGRRGDLFAVTVEKRTTSPVRLHDGTSVATTWTEMAVVARGSLARRCFLGGSVVEGYRDGVGHVIVADGAGGTPVVVIAADGEAPLRALNLSTGAETWVSADLGGAWALTASRRSRLFGASYRGSSKLVSADTGKYRWTWRGDVYPLLADGRFAVGLKRKAEANVLELRDASDGALLFARESGWVGDAVVTTDSVIVAGRGLHAFRLDGTPLWSLAADTSFSAIETIPDGFRAHSASHAIVDVRDGCVVREFVPAPLDDPALLGSDHLLSTMGTRSVTGTDAWDFGDALFACVARAEADHGAGNGVAEGKPSTAPERVFHRRFGWGIVQGRSDGKMRVKFDDGPERTLAAEFLSPNE